MYLLTLLLSVPIKVSSCLPQSVSPHAPMYLSPSPPNCPGLSVLAGQCCNLLMLLFGSLSCYASSGWYPVSPALLHCRPRPIQWMTNPPPLATTGYSPSWVTSLSSLCLAVLRVRQSIQSPCPDPRDPSLTHQQSSQAASQPILLCFLFSLAKPCILHLFSHWV
ncbi:hypothetical protein F5Y08DRAFT_201915 [Xylaria arbuscula]|nr:hypothetical protein F5Y08DRAFT_201915 [Xylaria arbuscula]